MLSLMSMSHAAGAVDRGSWTWEQGGGKENSCKDVGVAGMDTPGWHGPAYLHSAASDAATGAGDEEAMNDCAYEVRKDGTYLLLRVTGEDGKEVGNKELEWEGVQVAQDKFLPEEVTETRRSGT